MIATGIVASGGRERQVVRGAELSWIMLASSWVLPPTICTMM